MTRLLDEVIATADFHKRPSRPPDHRAENAALVTLSRVLNESPQDLLQRLVEIALDLCQADSVGISLLQPGDGGGTFRWVAIAGQYSSELGGRTRWDFSPCGITLQRNAPQLFDRMGRYFTYLNSAEPPIAEALLIPFEVEGELAGTIWTIANDERRKFDGEDLRLLTSLSSFAAAAFANLRRQESLRESEQKYRTLFETIDQGFCLVQVILDENRLPVDYRFMETNPTFEKQTGLKGAAGKTARELVPDLEDYWVEIYGKIALTGEPVRFENHSVSMGRWFDVYAYRVGPPEELKVAILFTDITKRKRAEESLYSSEARLRAVYDGTGQYMGLLSSDGTVLEANRASLEFIGRAREEIVGRLFWETPWWTHTPGAAGRLREAVLRAAGGEFFREEVSLKSPLGHTAIFDFSLHPIFNERGEVILIVPEAQDVTRRKHLEEERERLSKQIEVERTRLQYLFDYAPTFVALLRGPDHVFEIVNPIYYRLVGHRELIGRPAREAFPEVEGQGFFDLLDQAYKTGEPYVGREMSILLQNEPGGPLEERFLDFIYQAFFEADGTVSGIFVHGVDVTEQVAARRAVEEANRLKDEFLATLSHELRNPLNNILGYSELLRRSSEAKHSELIRKAAETIHGNAAAQSQLINDLLDLSRLQTGKLAVERQPVALAPIIGDAVETVRAQAGEKEIKLDVDLAAARLLVSADPVRMQQIVWNLVNNAVKFTPRGGRVSVRLSREGDGATLVVEDNGQGIAPEFLPHVFEMFRQADARTTRKFGGMGIGLALVRQLTELHGGRVEVYSEGAGRGASFTVRLPLHREPLADRSAASAARGAGELSGARILIVDDTQDSLDMLRLLLTGEGAAVETALSGAEGLKAASSSEFDLIISDISMPEMDGYEFLRALRAKPRYGETPAIALTGFGRDEDVERALGAGFNTHLTKPLDFDNLVKLACITLRR